MKPTELMLNDWVLHDGMLMRVTALTGNRITMVYGSNTISVNTTLDEVHPIPLGYVNIKRIIEQCFTCAEARNVRYFKYNDQPFLFEFGEDCYNPILTLHIEYVHQLQHAFRLLGVGKEVEL